MNIESMKYRRDLILVNWSGKSKDGKKINLINKRARLRAKRNLRAEINCN